MATKKTAAMSSRDAAATIRALKARIKELEAQRDRYLQTIKKLLPAKHVGFTRKELQEMEKFRPTFSEFVRDLRSKLNGNRRNGG